MCDFSFNPIQARLYLSFKGPRRVFIDPLMISRSIKGLKKFLVIVLLVYLNKIDPHFAENLLSLPKIHEKFLRILLLQFSRNGFYLISH